MKASERSDDSFNHRLNNFLLSYRSTPHSTTNVAPCLLFLGRQVRTRLDLFRPNVDGRVAGKQADQKAHHDSHAKPRELFLGQRVMVRNTQAGQAWVPGTVIECTEPLSYMVQIAGKLWKSHVDHLREMGEAPRLHEAVQDQSRRQEVGMPRFQEQEEPSRQHPSQATMGLKRPHRLRFLQEALLLLRHLLHLHSLVQLIDVHCVTEKSIGVSRRKNLISEGGVWYIRTLNCELVIN